jgi:Protein of unknown function (DUF3485)
MSRSRTIAAVLTLALMGATALLLLHMRSNHRLGKPGVLTQPMAGSKNLEVLLPKTVPGYTSEILTNAEDALLQLPADTSFCVRLYKATNDFFSQVTVVLMGSDRSSIHKPQICMTGQGWAIDNARSTVEKIHLDRPFPYDLPVNKLIASKQVKGADGNPRTISGIYLYWYVDANRITASENEWMLWWMPRDLLLNGVLERWAYISVFSPCLPGQEDATYDRMKKLIAEVVPDFQLVPHAGK